MEDVLGVLKPDPKAKARALASLEDAKWRKENGKLLPTEHAPSYVIAACFGSTLTCAAAQLGILDVQDERLDVLLGIFREAYAQGLRAAESDPENIAGVLGSRIDSLEASLIAAGIPLYESKQ